MIIFFCACSWCCNARDWCGSQDRSQDHYLRLSDSEVILLGPVSVSDWAHSQFLVKTDPDSANTVVTSNQSFWSTKTQSCRTLCSLITTIIETGVLLVLRSGMKGFYAFCPCLTCHNFQWNCSQQRVFFKNHWQSSKFSKKIIQRYFAEKNFCYSVPAWLPRLDLDTLKACVVWRGLDLQNCTRSSVTERAASCL